MLSTIVRRQARWLTRFVLLSLPLLWAGTGSNACAGPQVNAILENLNITVSVPGTTIVTNDDIANGNWSFEESNMDPFLLGNGFNNNRHEFYFSEDGTNPILIDGVDPWSVSFDVKLDGTFANPRKAFSLAFFDSGSNTSIPDSQINLTTNRTPNPNGASDPPGESAMFSGQYNFVRLIGPADGAPEINLNPTVGYTMGTTIHMEVAHVPSPDGGTTPSTVEYIYDDGTGPYTTGARDLRNIGVFLDGASLGFLIQGIAHESVGTDSYSVAISNFVATIGPPMGPPGDYNGNGFIDAADYTTWRDALTAGSSSLLNDPTPGTVDESDFTYWRDHFGDSMGAGAGATVSVVSVPEPDSLAILLTAVVLVWAFERRRGISGLQPLPLRVFSWG